MTLPHSPLRRARLLAPLLLSLAALPAQAQPAEQRAAAAAARGDLRAAQIEWRNAARQNPGSNTARLALAEASLEIGDGETAEREARAALQQGADPSTAMGLLLRAYLITGRHDALLRDFPEATPDPGGQVAAGRAMALLALGQVEPARAAIEAGLRSAPEGAAPNLAAAALAQAEGDRTGAELLIDRLLAREPRLVEALIRKGALLFARGEPAEAVQRFDAALAVTPGHVSALLRRAEARLALGQVPGATQDLDAALLVVPNSAAGHYLRAVVAGGARDWAAMDRALQRVGPLLGSFPDGFLLLATAKRGTGQMAQAEDAARRHLARNPADPRGAKLVAAFELQANRPADAALVLTQLAARGGADAEALDLLGRLHAAAGRRREAVAAFTGASQLAPQDAGLLARLAAAQLGVGDLAGMVRAAQGALTLNPTISGMRELLAFAALYRGDLAGVRQELARLTVEERRGEAARVLEASALIMQIDLRPARALLNEVLAASPGSVAARIALVRIARLEGRDEEMEALLGEVLRLDPANIEAAGQLLEAIRPDGPRRAQALGVLRASHAANPGNPALGIRLAQALVQAGEAGEAVALLTRGPLGALDDAEAQMERAEALAALGDFPAAEAASRAALAMEPRALRARRQLAALQFRGGDAAGAEATLLQGLREDPADPALLQGLAALVRQARGLDAALEFATRMAREPTAQPAGAALRGDILMAVNQPAEAARAYAAAQAERPSAYLALRHAGALRAAGQAEASAAALRAWLERAPEDNDAAMMISQLDIEAGRLSAAEQRLEALLERRPDDALALNNLAWLLRLKEDPAAALRARGLAERGYYLSPGADVADTLGWILARDGQPAQAVLLLRHSARLRPQATTEPGAAYRLAYALKASGARAEALAVLAPAMEARPASSFPERPAALQLLAELRRPE